jgi:hypothetical protein
MKPYVQYEEKVNGAGQSLHFSLKEIDHLKEHPECAVASERENLVLVQHCLRPNCQLVRQVQRPRHLITQELTKSSLGGVHASQYLVEDDVAGHEVVSALWGVGGVLFRAATGGA